VHIRGKFFNLRKTMKNIVVYYSQTKNTEKMAYAIQSGIREAGEPCDIARLRDVASEDLIPYDLIGLGSPVWHRREPVHVMNFIESTLNGVEGKQGFVFCTHGLMPGRFFARVVPIMGQRGLTVIGWKNWYCSVTMPEKPKPYFTDGHPDDIDLAEGKLFGREIIERSKRITAGEGHLIPTLSTGRAYDDLYPGTGTTGLPGGGYPSVGYSGDPRLDRMVLQSFDLKINRDKCLYPTCTICIDNCPLRSINLAASPPIFGKNCDRCWFCEQICPRGAIEVDWESLAKSVDAHVFPNFARLADEAEARGTFRRLIPFKDIDRHRYWYTVKKPPRIKL
jgi:flavodoxin/NAD-dependent dihydropyrimidine dehydrogenase PreA subunit